MNMRIGLVQERWGAPGGNIARYDRFAAEAAGAGCAMVLFPELSDTGYQLDKIPERAGTWPGAALEALQAAAQRHHIGIIAGLSERNADGIYNAAAALDRDGNLCGTYRKTHLFRGPEGAEVDVFRAGDALQMVTIDEVRWGLTICFDLRFPEVYRQLADNGAQILAVLAAWPRVRISDWSVLCRARAIENQVFLCGVNHAGEPFGGRSCVIAPDGDIKCECPDGSNSHYGRAPAKMPASSFALRATADRGKAGTTSTFLPDKAALVVPPLGGSAHNENGCDDGEAGLLTVDVDLDEIDRVRQVLPVMESRRPALYGGEG